jgi:ABC-type methionine transport system ATPase subunit
MFFDEPTSALDPTMVDEVETVIKSLCNEGMTSVIVTHEMSFVKNTASRVLFFAEKGIYEQGTPEEIFDNPKKSLTRKFLYHSRMYECVIGSKYLDIYSVVSQVRQYLLRFKTNQNTERFLSVMFDELLSPLFLSDGGKVEKAEFRLICSETSDSHMFLIFFPDVNDDPLSEKYTDAISLKILEHYSKTIFSHKKDNGWEICIQM